MTKDLQGGNERILFMKKPMVFVIPWVCSRRGNVLRVWEKKPCQR